MMPTHSNGSEPVDRRTDHSNRRSSTSFVTERPVAVLMMFVAAVVFGYFSYKLLPVTLMPELTYPTITVRTEYPGAAPEEVENDISRPIEQALGVIGGLTRISSISRADVSDVVLEFSWDTEMSEATQDCLEKLDLVFLPDEAKRPRVLHYDPSLDPVMELSLSGSGDKFEGESGLRRLRRIADLQVKRALEPIKGVAAVRIKGGLEEEIHVRLDEEELRRKGISIRQVIDRLRQENINVAGGEITEGRTEYMVRTLNEFEDIGQIGDTVVSSFEGRDVHVHDLGVVVMAHKDRQLVTRTDGGESVQIEIFKEADANIVSLAKRVKATVGELPDEKDEAAAATGDGDGDDSDEHGRGERRRATSMATVLFENEGVRLKVVADRSLFIESSIQEVLNTALIGGGLAVIVLFLFLHNVRTTLIIAVSIPLSILMTFAPLNGFGVTLNIMSLGGLALGIGMLVDSSIVVLESIFRRREQGDDLRDAAVHGTTEVSGAVFASTLTTIAVFFPMVFVTGIAGQAFGDLGLAVVVSLAASLLVAIVFIPMLASRSGLNLERARGGTRKLLQFHAPAAFVRAFRGNGTVLRVVGAPYFLIRLVIGLLIESAAKLILLLLFVPIALFGLIVMLLRPVMRVLLALPLGAANRLIGLLHRIYPPIIRWALASPVTVAMIVILTLTGTIFLAQRLDSELLPEVHQGEFTIEVALPVGTALEDTETVLAPLERAILTESEHIRALILTIGFDPANMQRSDEGEHTARFKILLEPEGRDAATEDAVIARLRDRLRAIPDLDARISRPVLFSSRTPIEVEVLGDDLRRLKIQADDVRSTLAALPQLADVDTTQRAGAPEVQIVYDRNRLTRYGLSIKTVAELIRDKVKGAEATRFNRKDRRIPIIVRLGADDRETVDDIRTLTVNPGSERPIPLSAIASVTLGEGPSEVRRVDGKRVALVRANIAEGSLGSATQILIQALDRRVEWPSDMTYALAGQNKEWDRSRSSLLRALGLSIFLVYVIMAAQFESLTQPLIIMFTIPLAFFGTMLALEQLGIALSVVVFLGMIMLAGIVVNNAIVLVDYINTLRKRGMETDAAIVKAGEVRLRPILMTTATTVLGLLPMALGFGDGAEIRTPMAIAVISGLITSTLLTLIVIPTAYSVIARLQQAFASDGQTELRPTEPGTDRIEGTV